jgi:hypothetical protein
MKVTMRSWSSRATFAAAASIAALGLGAANAAASFDPGDGALADTNGFQLIGSRLEPGCYLANAAGTPVTGHMDVTQPGREAHVGVLWDANFSVDQVLVPSTTVPGYKVYSTFDTGTNAADADIDPAQTATDLTGPGGANAFAAGIIVCISDHPDRDQNEPYVQDGLPGEVAATNRPILAPTIAALGVSAVGPLHTYKLGFGYTVQKRYDLTWRNLFNSGGDPMARNGFNAVEVDSNRPHQAGVRRYNDIDQFSEAFASGIPRSFYGQPQVFDVSGTGDPQAYLHNSAGLLTFTTQGDLPISWTIKPSLAPESYARSVSYTDDMFRAWNTAWQNYYAGKGPKPALPLAPGTNSPDPDPTINVVINPPETRPGDGAQKPVATTTIINQTTPATPVGPASLPAKPSVSAQLMKTKHGRMVQLFVNSTAGKANVQIKLYAHKHMVKWANKTVKTNRFVKVTGLKVPKKATSVKAKVL